MRWKVGIVGCGVISVAHLRGWARAKNAEVVGVFDLNRSLAEKRAQEFGIGRIHESLEELIESCDVVDICTPPQSHAKIVCQVIEAKRHLIVEKPLVTSLEDWERISHMLSESGVKIAVVHNLKFARSVRKAKSWVDQDRIGEVIAIYRQFLTNPADDRMLDAKGHWSHDLPGGRWFETLPHELYLIHYFAGQLEFSNVTAVRTAEPPPGVRADEVIVNLASDRCLATVHFSGNCGLNRRTLQIYGSKGMIMLDLLSDAAYLSMNTDARFKRAIGRLFMEGTQMMRRMIPDRMSYAVRRLRGETPHSVIIEEFANYLDGVGSAPTPLEEIEYVVRNCDRIGRAIDQEAIPSVFSENEHLAL